MIIDGEQLRNELRDLPGESVLALDDLRGGRIPVESVRLKRIVKPEKPGMSSETLLLILSDTPEIGSSRFMTVEHLRNLLKRVPLDVQVVFDDLKGKMVPVESVRREHPVQFEKPGTHSQTALVILSENPWN